MSHVSVAEAKARLSEILADVATGGDVIITRRGLPIARVTAIIAARRPIDFATIERLRGRQPAASLASVDLIRRMRDAAL